MVTRALCINVGVAGVVALTLGLAADARAQSGSHGGIIGNVLDQNGMPIKGVKISARSDTQIGGAKVAYTSDEGSFRIVGLIPGEFEITASAPKMKTVMQKGILVGLNAPAEVDIIMEVETKVEEVKVVEKAPTVSTTTAVVKEVFDEEFIDNIPVNTKTAGEQTISDLTPGAVGSGVRSTRIRGGKTTSSHFLVEGFYMNGQRSTMKAMAAVEVLSAGQGAENASASGGVVNMVTKSGSNKFEFDVNGYAEHKALQFFLDESDNPEMSYYYMINPWLSG
jgi:outer membrane receptor protein involved in Fe transport